MIFKKYFVVFLSLLLLVSNCGFALNARFCCEKLVAFALLSSNVDDCEDNFNSEKKCCSPKEKQDKCCDTKRILLQTKLDQSVLKEVQSVTNSFVLLSIFVIKPRILNKNQNAIVSDFWVDFLIGKPPLFKLFCSFIIYG